MELIVFITVVCFSFFALQTPCTSLQTQLQSSTEQGKLYIKVSLSLVSVSFFRYLMSLSALIMSSKRSSAFSPHTAKEAQIHCGSSSKNLSRKDTIFSISFLDPYALFFLKQVKGNEAQQSISNTKQKEDVSGDISN